MQGKVKFFNQRKGFGFVTGDDGKDYFIHITGLKPGVRLRDNDVVSFEVEQSDRGLKAVDVALLQKGSEMQGGRQAPAETEEQEDDFDDSEDMQ